MTARHGRRSETGSALLIALVFVTTISLVVAAILSFADVGMRASNSYRVRANVAYAADGAITAALKRYSTTGPCDNFIAPLVGEPPGTGTPLNGQGTIVRCEGPPPAGSRATQPVNTLLSLGTGPGDGITSSQELRLLGDVFSNTTVSTAATMVVQGEVSAVGDCTGPIQTAPPSPLRCANASTPERVDPSRGRDPDHTPAITAVPVRRTVPSCPAEGWLVKLEPGYYDDADDADGLSALTGGACSGKVVWFQPGTYYFDLAFQGGPGTWTVDDPTVDVVAGAPKGWDPEGTSRPTLSVPGSCQTNGDPTPIGVQLIAGGGTRLEITAGRMELCATPSTTEQQIAIFGLRDALPTHVQEATDLAAVGFSPALSAQKIEETPVATAAADLGPDLTSASLDFEAFRPGVPTGSVIDAVILRVRHRQDGDPVGVTVNAAFPGSSGPCPPVPALAPSPGAGVFADDRIDLTAGCGLTTPEGLAGLEVTYTASLEAGGTATVEIDGVVVEVAYRTPVTRKPTKVLAAPGFTDPAAPPERAFEIGEQPLRTADAALSSSTTSASVTLAGMGDPPLPADATIDSAVLRVAHAEQGDTGGPVVSASVGGCSTLPPLARREGGITDDRVNLKACGLDTPAELQGLTATFTATLSPGGGTALSRLDGMWLEIVSSGGAGPAPPALRRAETATATGFADPDHAKVVSESSTPLTADSALSGAATTATLTVKDFDRIPLPPGSRIDGARLRVAHQEDANVGSVGVTASVPAVPGYPGGTCSPPPFPNSVGGVATDQFDLALCGLASPDQLAGLTATYTATRSGVARAATQIAAVAVGDAFAGAQQDGRSIDGLTADAALAAGGLTTASVRLDGYDQPPPPAGSIIDGATLRVVHRDEGAAATVTVTFPGGTCTAEPLAVRSGALGEDTVDLKACNLTDPAQLAGLSVLYRADLAVGRTDATNLLDGAELALTYRPPAVASLDGIELDIVFQPPALTPLCTGCELVKVAPATTPSLDTATRFIAGGTIYAPTAGVDITMYGIDSQVLRRGVIARAISLGLQPAAGYQRPTGAIPPELVVFTAYPDETLTPTTAVAVPASGFSDPDNARARRDGLTADADVNITTPAMLELSGFEETDLPASARIDAAVLRVTHQDDANTEVSVTVKVGATTCATQVLTARPEPLAPTSPEDQVDLRACGLDSPTKLDDVTVTYTAAKKDPAVTAAVAKLDGISLEVLSRPLVRATVTFDRARATVEAWSVLR